MIQTLLELSWRWFTRTKKSLTFWTSVVGLALGVASLTVAMAVMSGFEKTLQKHVADLTGHVRLYRLVGAPETFEELEKKLKTYPEVTEIARFLHSQGLVAKNGKMIGVQVQGIEESRWKAVLNLEDRLVDGTFDLSGNKCFVGKVFAETFALKPGDKFRLVSPIWDENNPAQFSRKVVDLEIAAVLDFGKYDFDQKWILTSLATLQKAAEIDSNKESGVILKTTDIARAPILSRKLTEDLGSFHRIRDWREAAEVIFEAVEVERIVIFFVILVIVIAAVFSVGSYLYISVIQRQSDLSLLRALGLSQKNILLFLGLQGLIVSAGGILAGAGMGIVVCMLLSFLQRHFHIISGKVYSLDFIDWSIRPQDIFMIFLATTILCLIAIALPARKASKLSISQGVRSE